MKQLVIIPGGFHPFHAGHAALYQSAQAAFPAADVYVAATNDTSTRPFPFAIKEKLAKLAGVAPDHFIQVKSPFRAEEIVHQFNPNDTQLIFVRSEKDANKPPQGGGTKKDGSPSYLQPLGDDTQPLSQHAYMAYLPTVEFGPGMTSATEIRGAWPNLNEKRKTALVMSLYPATQKNPKLAVNVVKMLDTAMGVVDESAPGNLPRPNKRNQFKSLHRLRKQRGLDEQGVAENTATGINRMFNNLGDPVYSNLQRVALLAMQGRQSEAAGRLQSVIKDASTDIQKKITDAVNNIKPVTINGKIADSSTLDKSKQHNDWIINTFIPWVQSLLGQQGVAEGSSDNIPIMGINVRSDGDIDYASLIVDGEKKYESRKTDSLRPYVGKIVGIVRTGNGPAVAIGQVTIGEPIIVDAEKFNRFRKQHLVPQGSKFDIDSDGTKYLYPMIDTVRWDNEKPVKHRGIVSRKIQEQGVAEEMQHKKITELFDAKTAFPLKWDTQFASSGEVHAEAYDADGRIIDISFTPTGYGSGIEIVFKRGGSYDMTGHGDAPRVLATVVNAISQYLQQYQAPYIAFSAKSTGGRAGAYAAMIRRLARGYKLLTPDEYPDDAAGFLDFLGSDKPFILARS